MCIPTSVSLQLHCRWVCLHITQAQSQLSASNLPWSAVDVAEVHAHRVGRRRECSAIQIKAARGDLLQCACFAGSSFALPTASEKIFAVTGATAVCLVVYVVPVVIHLLLHYKHPCSRLEANGAEEHLLQDGQAATGEQSDALKRRRCRAEVLGWLDDVVVPGAVLVVGVGFSFAALWVAIGQLLTQ